MRPLLLLGLAACTGGPVPDSSAAPSAVQVNLALEGVSGAPPPLDVWVSRGLAAPVAEGRTRGGPVSLTTPPGSWEIWVASALAADTGGARLACSGHATGVAVEPGATTVVTVAVRCAPGG